jgi:hypothetical protein
MPRQKSGCYRTSVEGARRHTSRAKFALPTPKDDPNSIHPSARRLRHFKGTPEDLADYSAHSRRLRSSNIRARCGLQ